MPANYDAIRAENIARYGWDTAVLELLGALYSDRTHFIFELIQNAEDAGATELGFALFGDRLEVRHDGRPFTEADVRGICGVSQGTKAHDLTQIGRFGIGFKSVYAYTNTPVITSGDERFRIENYVRPHGEPEAPARPPARPATEPLTGPDDSTLFVFPFDRDEVPATVAVDEIARALAGLDAETLLFLRNLHRISIDQINTDGSRAASAVLRRRSASGAAGSRQVILSTEHLPVGHSARRIDATWLVWARALDSLGEPELRVEIAFSEEPPTGALRQPPNRRTMPLIVYFPTQKETFLGFFVAGPYRTTPARDNVPEADPWNAELIRQTAGLLGEVLTSLRDEALLTTDVLTALPLDPERFGAASMFGPLFDAALAAFGASDLVPDAEGGYRGSAGVVLADSAELRELLTSRQLGELLGAASPVAFADETITETATPPLWHYLRDQVGVTAVTPREIVARMSQEFLTAQSDEWLARFYLFLYRNQSLWAEPVPPDDAPGPARTLPVVRLQDGTQVRPFTGQGRPAAYLPGPVETGFPTVRRAIAADPGARRFLDALGYAEADVLAQVLDHVLPRYAADLDVERLDPARHSADVELVALALADAPAAERERVLDQLAQTEFLVGENAATGERRLIRPGGLYQRTKALETYFDGNAQAWFAADTYGPWAAQLRTMGVRAELRPQARPADELGYVVVVRDFARNERGVAGFDPAASLDGLEYALAHPTYEKSEFIWNAVLLPNRHLLAGVVERSVRVDFSDARRTRTWSPMGELAGSAAWLPAPDGSFRRPEGLQLGDLPASFTPDAALASALGLSQPSVDEANSQLGFPPGFLLRLSRHPDLVEQIERELGTREAGRREPPPVLL